MSLAYLIGANCATERTERTCRDCSIGPWPTLPASAAFVAAPTLPASATMLIPTAGFQPRILQWVQIAVLGDAMRFVLPAGFAVLFGPQFAWAAGEKTLGVHPVAVAPFILLLLAIAFLPMLARQFW